MRIFNKRERNILKMLYNISNDKFESFDFYLQKNYFKDLIASALVIIPSRKEVILYVEISDFNDIEKRKAIMIEFMEFLSLVNFLKEERYINLMPIQDALESSIYIMRKDFDKISYESESGKTILNKKGDYIDQKQGHLILNSHSEVIFEGVRLPYSIFDQVIENCMGLLFVSEELKEFVKNDYRSKEDIRYNRNQIATWVGISIAILFGFLGIYIPH